MKSSKCLVSVGLATVLTAFACSQVAVAADAPTDLTPAAAEVVKLAESGVGDDVIQAYIQNAQTPFQLSAGDVVYLKDLGVSSPAITGMLNRDTTLRSQPAQPYNYDQKLYGSPGAAPAPAPAPVATTAPEQQPAPAPGPVAAPAAPAPAYDSAPPTQVTYFYNDLAPYGTWVQLDGYGWCWQPRTVVINHGWRPYCDAGHWIYSDAGWYWQSDYSWGWAPFHYGRWVLHERCGWVWMPDTVWGPAWVAWRSAGDNCGWAPLPPHADFVAGVGFRFNGVRVAADFDFGLGVNSFMFIGFGDFCSHDLGHRCLPRTEVTRIYSHTTIINNYTVNKTVIVNNGFPVERISAATHMEIRRAAVSGEAVEAGHHALVGKNETVIYRPQLKAEPKVAMVAQRLDAQHPVIQHAAIAPAVQHRETTPAVNRTAPAVSRQQQEPMKPAETHKTPSTSPYYPAPAARTETKSQPVQSVENNHPAAASPAASEHVAPQAEAEKSAVTTEPRNNSINRGQSTYPTGNQPSSASQVSPRQQKQGNGQSQSKNKDQRDN